MKYFFDNVQKKNDWNAINIYKYTFDFDIIEKKIKMEKIKDEFNESKLHYILNYLMRKESKLIFFFYLFYFIFFIFFF